MLYLSDTQCFLNPVITTNNNCCFVPTENVTDSWRHDGLVRRGRLPSGHQWTVLSNTSRKEKNSHCVADFVTGMVQYVVPLGFLWMPLLPLICYFA